MCTGSIDLILWLGILSTKLLNILAKPNKFYGLNRQGARAEGEEGTLIEQMMMICYEENFSPNLNNLDHHNNLRSYLSALAPWRLTERIEATKRRLTLMEKAYNVAE